MNRFRPMANDMPDCAPTAQSNRQVGIWPQAQEIPYNGKSVATKGERTSVNGNTFSTNNESIMNRSFLS